MYAPSRVNWTVIALQIQEEALRCWMTLPVLQVRDNQTGELIDVSVDRFGFISGWREEMMPLFRKGFARDWLIEAKRLRQLVVRSQQLLKREGVLNASNG